MALRVCLTKTEKQKIETIEFLAMLNSLIPHAEILIVDADVKLLMLIPN